MKSVSLNGIARVNLGKGFSKKIRNNGQVPCVIYGGSTENPVHICIESNQLKKVIYTPNVYKLTINIANESHDTIIRDIQFHPVNDEILHVDFLKLKEDKLVSLEIPVKLNGNAIGVLNGGVLNLVMRKLILKGFPKNIPDQIDIDINDLRIGHSVRIEDILIDNEVEFLHPSTLVVVAVKTARAVIEEEEEEETSTDEQAEGGEKAAEGGEKAAGEGEKAVGKSEK